MVWRFFRCRCCSCRRRELLSSCRPFDIRLGTLSKSAFEALSKPGKNSSNRAPPVPLSFHSNVPLTAVTTMVPPPRNFLPRRQTSLLPLPPPKAQMAALRSSETNLPPIITTTKSLSQKSPIEKRFFLPLPFLTAALQNHHPL